jgi:hypothetical protein
LRSLDLKIQRIDSRNWEPEKEQITGLFRAVRRIHDLGDCEQIKVTGPIHVSPYTRLFLGQLPQRAEKILIKCCYQNYSDLPDVETAQLLFDALVHLNERRTAGIKFNLVKPFHLFQERAIVVQSWIEGQSLERAFADRSVPIHHLRGLLREAGEWLAHFHRFGAERERTTVTVGLVEDVERGAVALGKSGRHLASLVRRLQESGAFDGSLSQAIATLHCDFKPSNLIATGSGILAIDFQRSKPASVYFDIAHFLNSTVIDAMNSKRLSLILQVGRLRRAFIEGYESVAGPIDPLVLALYLNYDLGRYILHHGETGPVSAKARIKRWVMERLLDLRFAEFRLQHRRRSRMS